jgi:hypothetical protein
MFLKKKKAIGLLAHNCNPNYFGGKDRRIVVQR